MYYTPLREQATEEHPCHCTPTISGPITCCSSFLSQFQLLVPSQIFKTVFIWHSEMYCGPVLQWDNSEQIWTNRTVVGAKGLKIVHVPDDAIDNITTCWRPDCRNRAIAMSRPALPRQEKPCCWTINNRPWMKINMLQSNKHTIF